MRRRGARSINISPQSFNIVHCNGPPRGHVMKFAG